MCAALHRRHYGSAGYDGKDLTSRLTCETPFSRPWFSSHTHADIHCVFSLQLLCNPLEREKHFADFQLATAFETVAMENI